RIDRAFICTDFDCLLGNCRLSALERVESDHCPIMIEWGFEERLHRYWKFENMWFLDESFIANTSEWWNCQPRGVGDLFLFGQRLRMLKEKIRKWNKEEFRKVDVRIAEILAEIKMLDGKEEDGPISVEDRSRRDTLKYDLDKVLLMEEVAWRQKSRENWLKVGDMNSRYFHGVVNHNRRRNFISSLKFNGTPVEGQSALKAAFVEHYSAVFKEEKKVRPFPASYGGVTISDCERNSLVRQFSEEEIWMAVRKCRGDKAPGPDGFSLEFFKKCWDVIKSDMLKAFEDFFIKGELPICIAHSFLCLIPKKESVIEVKDLRPISLIGSVNKIISKVLTERLKPIMSKLISGNQFSGIRGRQIHEASLIANELVDSRRKSGKPGLIFKLDIEKAFDNVNWECLVKIMASFGFPPAFQRWIHGLVSSAHLSVLVNGEAAGFFKIGKGLRQGDPMSPFLFNLVMDVLSMMLERLRVAGLITGFCMDEGNRRGEVTHLLYANDTIIFCDADEDQVMNILATIICFQTVTGLRINVEKSKMHPIGSVDNPDRLAAMFGCGWSYLPTVYLGLPLGASPNSVSVWNPVLTRFQSRLEGWRGKFLSLGGRLTLASSVLSSQPLFLGSICKAPKSVIGKMEKSLRRFIWSGVQDKGRYHLVNWQLCKALKKEGGLGILDMASMNSALLSKWLWKFATEKEAWWRKMISIKFPNPSSLWKAGQIDGRIGCSLWKSIAKEESCFWKFAVVDPGGGAWVSFWQDRWNHGMTLGESFPRVAAASALPQGWVSEFVSFSSERGVSWNLPLILSLRGGLKERGVIYWISCQTFLLVRFHVVLAGLCGRRVQELASLYAQCTNACVARSFREWRISRSSQYGDRRFLRKLMDLLGCSFIIALLPMTI
ncbi:unnamed protein product, partial [Linum tenue]